MSVTGIQSGAFQAALAKMRERVADGHAKAVATIEGVVSANEAKFEQAAKDAAAKAQREIDEALAEFGAHGDNGGPA